MISEAMRRFRVTLSRLSRFEACSDGWIKLWRVPGIAALSYAGAQSRRRTASAGLAFFGCHSLQLDANALRTEPAVTCCGESVQKPLKIVLRPIRPPATSEGKSNFFFLRLAVLRQLACVRRLKGNK